MRNGKATANPSVVPRIVEQSLGLGLCSPFDPQRLKPLLHSLDSARLKPCPPASLLILEFFRGL
jgi:hypothetical protein